MSTIRDKFFEDKAIGALWDVAVSIKRGNPLPLDSNSVFDSYSALETYAAGVLAYPGQIVAVVNADSTGIYYLDQNLAINEVGKIPTADNKSIEIADGVITMHDYGTAYYKYVPEEKNEETGEVIKEAGYEKTAVVEGTTPWKAGLEPRVVSENGEFVIGWFEPNPTTVEGVKDQVTAVQGTVNDLDEIINKEGGLVDQVEDLQEEIGHAATETGDAATGLYAELEKKADKDIVYTKEEANGLFANAADVYTKEEANTAIATAVNNAAHLKRVILNAPTGEQTVEDVINQWLVDNQITTTADQYIFMIPTGLSYDSNKYYEYIVIVGEETNTVEQVGNWEVDLSDYVSDTELEDYLKDYYTSAKVDEILEAYATTAALTVELKKYYTIEQLTEILDGYYTDDEVDALLANIYSKTDVDDKFKGYYTKNETDGLLSNKVEVVEGKSLVLDTEIAKLATVKENAEENYIKSVSERFTVSEAGQLGLKPITTADIDGFDAAMNTKVDKIVYDVPVVDENGDPVYEDDGVTPKTEKVEGTLLSPTDKQKLDILVIGDGGNIEISGKVNASNVEGLNEWVVQNRDKIDGLYPTAAAQKLANIQEGAEKNFITAVEPTEFGVDDNGTLTLVNVSAKKLINLSGDFTYVEGAGLSLTEDYVTTSDYVTGVGDLSKLLRVAPGEGATNIVDEINYINERIAWQDMKESDQA